MAKVVATVQDIQGRFYAKDAQGDVVELSVGDPIEEGMLVFADSNNAPQETIELTTVAGEDVVLTSQEEQLFDTTLSDNSFDEMDTALQEESLDTLIASTQDLKEMEEEEESFEEETTAGEKEKKDSDELGSFAARDGNIADVNSGLRDAGFGTSNNNFETRARFDQDDEKKKESTDLGNVEARSGNIADVNSDLRDARFKTASTTYEIKSRFEREDGEGIEALGNNFNTVFETPRPTPINNIIPNPEPVQTLQPDPRTPLPIQTPDPRTPLPIQTPEPTPEPVNGIPKAIDDARVIVKEGGSSVNGQLLSNDIPGSDGLVSGKELKEFTYNGVTYTFDNANPSYTINGTTLGDLTVNRNGTWELDPSGVSIGTHTEDSFTYKIVDSDGDVSNSATQPLLMFDKEVADTILTTTSEDTSKLILLNDIGGDVTITDSSSSTQKTLGTNESINITDGTNVVGTVTNNGDGTIIFDPAAHYCGNDAVFGYEVTRSDNTTVVNDSVTVEVTPRAESKATDTDGDSNRDVVTQGNKTYASIDESASYSYISLTGLNVTNEDDRGNGANPFASEVTTVKLSGVPVGFKFKYNDGSSDVEQTVTDVNDGVTIPFEYISTLQIKPTDYFAGEIKVKMEVITQDCETLAEAQRDEAISTPDYLTINVKNVANGIGALNAAQATGDEDAGRGNGNTTNDSSPESITDAAAGIDIDIDATTVDTSGREEVTTIIDEIPDGGAIYYSDANGTITVDNNGVVSGSNANVSIIDNANGTWKVTIADFKNNAPLKFIPPHNSNDDYTFKVTAYTVDGSSLSSTSEEKTTNVQITGVADIPVHDDFKKLDSDGVINADTGKNIYSDVVIEDNSNTRSGATISFEDLYKEAGLASYDSDASETLSVTITNLGSNFSVETINGQEFNVAGISFNGASGASREWSFDIAALSNVMIKTSKNFSGDFDFKVKHTTTENDNDSKTFEKDVSILVKPLVEATVTTSANATEDEVSQVSFAIKHQNGDTNETLDALWINKTDVTGKDFTLYYSNDSGTTLDALTSHSTVDGDYYKLDNTAIDKIYIKYNSNVGSADTSNNSFDIKYTVSDTVTANGETFTSTNEKASGVYNISLLSVTDSISVDTSNAIATTGNIAYDSDAKTVTLNGQGSFTLDVDITGDSDTDGSEKATRLVIEGVQRGITVDGATMGISGDKNIWFLDIPDQDIDADGAKYTVTFNVNYSITPDTNSTIKITAYSKDSGSASDDIKLASTEIEFIDNMIDGGGAGAPAADIDAVMSVKNTLITEDTSFTLADVLTVTADTVHDTDNNAIYSIAFRSLEKVSFDMDLTTHTINTYNDNGVNVYVVTATGSQASIDSMLNSVYLKPNQDYNTNNAASTNLTFNAVLTAYEATGVGRDTATVDFSSANNATSVKPVTDDITSSVIQTHVKENSDAVGSAQEDGTTTIKISFDTVDAPDYTIVQGAENATAAVTVAITHKSGIYGTLTWSGGGTYTFDASNKVANVLVSDIGNGNLKFTPTEDASGNATFTYTVFAKETGADNISETSKDFTINVAPVADGLNLPELKGEGDEDTYIQIYSDFSSNTPLDNATQIDDDGSESIMSMFIKNVPENFAIYIGESGSQSLATNSGGGKWTINISGGIPKVWLKAPDGWSDTNPIDLQLETVVKDGSSTTNVTKDFTVTVNSVVDGFDSVTPNNTTQTASADIDINLNAQAGDLDGSETGILTLTGLGAGATFKQDGVAIDNANIEYSGDTYTISDISLATDKLNKLTFQQGGLHGASIDYTFKTVESDDPAKVSNIKSGTFTATTDNIITNTAAAGRVGETDRLELSAGGIDFSTITSTSIEKIDLTQNGDTNITNITMDDVIARTDGANDLIIIANDANDRVTFKASDGWAKESGTSTYGNQTFETYTNSGDPSVTVKVSDEAIVSII